MYLQLHYIFMAYSTSVIVSYAFAFCQVITVGWAVNSMPCFKVFAYCTNFRECFSRSAVV